MVTNDDLISSRYVRAGNLNIHYLTAGEGEPVVLLHGWPTHSYLWRKIIKPLANMRRVIVPDLPGFGKSDKPLDVSYGFDYQSSVLDEILNSLNIKKTALVVHDIGGPIGLHWAIRNQEKLERLAILDTLLKTVNDIKIDDLREIIKKLPELGIPISIIYGEKDIWLASEMRRIKQEIPDSDIIGIPNCGHFLQEDQPERLSELLVEFLSK